MKKRKLKGLTLIELIVAMAVFAILMAGIMNMTRPVQEGATQAKVMNYQKTAEDAVVSYIGEQLRYATNIMIAEQGSPFETDGKFHDAVVNAPGKYTVDSPAKAAQLFLNGFGLRNKYGEWVTCANCTNSNQNVAPFFHCIIWDGTNFYDANMNSSSGGNKGYKGRMFTSYRGDSNVGYANGGNGAKIWVRGGNGLFGNGSNSNPTTLAAEYNYFVKGANTKNQFYPVYGSGYFGNVDLYLSMDLSADGFLTIRCDSDYYANASGKQTGKVISTAGNPTIGTYQLRNWPTNKLGDGTKTSSMHFISAQGSAGDVADGTSSKPAGISCGRGTTNLIYIFYTTEQDMEDIMNYRGTGTWRYPEKTKLKFGTTNDFDGSTVGDKFYNAVNPVAKGEPLT